MIFGFLNICKSQGCTSHDVISILRKKIGIRQIGHAGTLDPFATGVLLIGINNATRLFEYIPSDKIYIGEITFGFATDTDDITGKITDETSKIPSLNDINTKINSFIGRQKQKPPVYSAIKINGERAYKLARHKEIELVDINEKEIEIYSIEIISYENNKLKLKIHCSSGTYIRSIARDFGKSLNSLGTLSSLERISIGNININNSISLEMINSITVNKHLIPPQEIIKLKKVYLNNNEVTDIQHGKTIQLKTQTISEKQNLQLMSTDNKLIAIGEYTNNKLLQPRKVLI